MTRRAPSLPKEAVDTCAGCKFWLEQTEAADKVRNGLCRRSPPALLYDQEDGALCLQPMTESDDWCGEFAQALQS